MTELALFPIPNCVLFPGMVFPLHVFEPRYRSMIQHCLDTGMEVAVCHVEKVLHEGEHHQDLEDALQSNQDTYKPKSVFTAGRCELFQTLDDGRLLVNIHTTQRYQLTHIVQTLPFNIAQCEPLEDLPVIDTEHTLLLEYQDKIMHRLLALSAHEPEVHDTLKSDHWQNMDATEFCWQVFCLIGLEPDVQQDILEDRQPVSRLKKLLDILNQN